MPYGIQHYDIDTDALHFACPVCGWQEAHDMSTKPLLKHHPTERAMWSLNLGACSGCAKNNMVTEHFLNLNLPDGHPHALHINNLLQKKHGPDLPKSSSPPYVEVTDIPRKRE